MVAVKQKLPYLTDGSVDVDLWLQNMQTQYQLTEVDLIKKAIYLAKTIGKGLTTFYGQPCIEQGLEMAEITLDLTLDQEAIAAAIMMSTVQNAHTAPETIKEELGENIAKLIKNAQQMNTLDSLIAKNRDAIQIDRLRKAFLGMASDIRVVLIKLAERICIMRGIKNINPKERKRIALETMDIYAPLANRLGIGQLKWELEDISFHYTDPDTYKMIAKFLAERRTDREQHIHKTIAQLQKQLEESHIQAKLSGRAKHIYSIYSKMNRKNMHYKNIYDSSAIRILVPSLDDCYHALSIVHQLYEHIPEEFDDYISNPKPNGYKSIHTAVVGSDGKNLEIQIRTYAMNDEAEHGVAAHWIYKENNSRTPDHGAKIFFLRQLIAWHKEIAQTDEKPIQSDLEGRIYVFTPDGEIVDLPIGATPLDFAYHIHSELGHRCRGAKINGQIVPLTYALQTADRIEIMTIVNGAPSRDWLSKDSGYITTARARAKVAQWFRQQDATQYIDSGRRVLERELSRTGIEHLDLHKIAAELNFKNEDALLSALGHGSLRAAQIIHAANAKITHETIPKIIPTHPKKEDINVSGLQIAGINDLMTRIAKCCKPIPGDAIFGFITQGRGVSIHKKNCSNISRLSPLNHRLIEVSWDKRHLGTYYVDLQVQAQSGKNLLNEITAIISNSKIDLISINSNISKKSNMMFISITVQVHNIEELKKLSHDISQLPSVLDVRRMRE
jgi:GTP pyrophosphokinase